MGVGLGFSLGDSESLRYRIVDLLVSMLCVYLPSNSFLTSLYLPGLVVAILEVPKHTVVQAPERFLLYKSLRPRCTSPTLASRTVPWFAMPASSLGVPKIQTRAYTHKHTPRDDDKCKPIELIESVTRVQGGLMPNRTPAQYSMLLSSTRAPCFCPCLVPRNHSTAPPACPSSCHVNPALAHGWVNPS
ncbi:hypothetical protein LZ32DRAFT_21930 [Colletotrichum eremochloae]|nr:hypothetical protein LZ32DRAFT_21930 [Colletotrichum eremochloae]